jgi:hypothetical protein
MTQPIYTSEPRVNLPPLDSMTVPEVRQAAETYVRLYAARGEQQQAVEQAKRAVWDGQAADERALAQAMVDGTREPKARALTKAPELVLAETDARWKATQQAVRLAHSRLADAVDAHAAAWSAQVAAEHADALDRYTRAAGELSTAARDLTRTGEVLDMLRGNPRSLTVGTYRPAPRLSYAEPLVAEAVADVLAHEAANAPTPEPGSLVADDEGSTASESPTETV